MVAVAILYGASAVKQHVNASSTVEAMFKGVEPEYLKDFVIKRPEKTSESRGSRALKILQHQFDKIESKLLKLIRALNSNLVSADLIAKRTTLCDLTKERFLTYDPMIAKIFITIYNSMKVVITTLLCLKPEPPISALPEATTNSSPGMLVLSIHLNNLVTWAIAVFSVSLTSDKLNKDNAFSYYLTLTGFDAALSCISGFFIACYLIKKL